MKSLIVADDYTATEWVSEGIQTARLAIFPQVVIASACGVSILTFRQGKVASASDYYDMASFLTQLGGTT